MDSYAILLAIQSYLACSMFAVETLPPWHGGGRAGTCRPAQIRRRLRRNRRGGDKSKRASRRADVALRPRLPVSLFYSSQASSMNALSFEPSETTPIFFTRS